MLSRIVPLFLVTAILSSSVTMPAYSDDKKAEKKTEKKVAEKKAKKNKKPNTARLKKMFGKKDKDGDGYLSTNEFVVVGKKVTDEKKIERRKKALGKQFVRKDKNKDGKLSQQEFVAQLKKPNKKNAKNAKNAKKKRAGKKKKNKAE